MRCLWVGTLCLGLASQLHAQTYQGCGSDFHTCASVTVTATPSPTGGYDVTVTAANLSYGSAKGRNRYSLLAYITLNGFTVPQNTQATLTGFDGQDLTGGITRTDGRESFGWEGYREDFHCLDHECGVFSAILTGAVDPRCLANPGCANHLPQDTGSGTLEDPRITYHQSPGAMTFRFHVPQFASPGGVTVYQWPIGGGIETGKSEFYALHTTTTPEPVSLTLMATGLVGIGWARRKRTKGPS